MNKKDANKRIPGFLGNPVIGKRMDFFQFAVDCNEADSPNCGDSSSSFTEKK